MSLFYRVTRSTGHWKTNELIVLNSVRLAGTHNEVQVDDTVESSEDRNCSIYSFFFLGFICFQPIWDQTAIRMFPLDIKLFFISS